MPQQNTVLALEHLLEILPAKPNSGSKKDRYELLFDSFIHSALEATRTSVVSARQLLFRIGAIFVDVEVGREANSDRASLIGQMLDSSNPGHPPVGVSIVLVDRGRKVACTSSNDNGEFQFQFAIKNNLKLSVAVDRDRPVYLPITSPRCKTNTVSAGSKRTASRSCGNVLVQ
jgi:hypothetical protein